MSRIDFRRFDPSWLKDNVVVQMIGKRGTGKTTAMLNICKSKRKGTRGVVFCGTAGSNEDVSPHFPPAFTYGFWSEQCLRSYFNLVKEAQSRRRAAGKPLRKYYAICDDCAFDDKFLKCKTVREIVNNGRHYNIFFLFTQQYLMRTPPEVRSQTDWVFIFKETLPAMRKKLYDQYCQGIGSFDLFCAVMDRFTEDFGCLVVRNTGSSNKVEDCFFYWKAKQSHHRWKMGHRTLWEASEKYYDPESAITETPVDDPQAAGKKFIIRKK